MVAEQFLIKLAKENLYTDYLERAKNDLIYRPQNGRKYTLICKDRNSGVFTSYTSCLDRREKKPPLLKAGT